MERNPYLGQTVDPYHGAEWIDRNRPIPDVSRHTLPVSDGQTIDQYGNMLMEPRRANVRSAHIVSPASASMSVVSTATSATPGDMPRASELTGTAHHHERSLAQTVAGVAVLAGATYVVAKAADSYIGNDPRRYWRWIQVWTAIYLAIFVVPFVVAAMMTGEATLVLLSTPFLIPLGFGWLMAINDPKGKRPTDAEQQARYEERMAVPIADYDRRGGQGLDVRPPWK